MNTAQSSVKKQHGFRACSAWNVTHQRLCLCGNSFFQTDNMNIDCCLNHNCSKSVYKLWKVENDYPKCRLFTKLDFIEYEKIMHCLYCVWTVIREKYSLNTGFRLVREH